MGILYAFVNGLSQAQLKYNNAGKTGDLLRQAKEVLLAYAITYPDTHTDQVFGYLPCPDMDGDGSADASDSDCGGTDKKAVVGLLPYKQLGLPSNVDAEGNCLWYAVSGSFKASTTKPTPMNWDTQGQFEIRDDQDNLLEQPDNANGGGAAVVFAVGPPIGTQSRTTQTNTAPCGVSSANKAASIYSDFIEVDATKADRTRSEPFPGPANGTVRLVAGTTTSTTNNDRLVWITPKEIWDRIRKRSDIATSLDQNINSSINDIQGKLTNQLASYSNGGDYALPALSYAVGSMLANYYDNFSDQFRFRKCPSANTYCFTVNGTACDGVLLFGGMGSTINNGTASPRPATLRTNSYYMENLAGSGLPLLTAAAPTNASPAIVTAAAQSFSSSSLSTDIVQCLTPQPPVQINAAQMFDATNTSVITNTPLIATNGSTALTLGNNNPGSNASLLYGCFWYPTAQPFGTGLRIYYEYVTDARGEGYTFALADADPARNPSTSMCGNAQDALGYAGNNLSTAVINYPKMALEFDFKRSNPGPLNIQRNDPTSSPSMHFAFDYWGLSSGANSGDDDVTHGAGDGTNDPKNPSVSPGIKQFTNSVTNGAKVYVRFDITRAYSSTTKQGSYILQAYIIRADTSSGLPGTFPSGISCGPGLTLLQSYMKDTTADLASTCASLPTTSSTYLRYLSDTITIKDISGLGEAMRRVYLGFTTSQQTSVSQQITITNFSAVAR